MIQININDIIGNDFIDLLPKIMTLQPEFSHLWLAGGRGSLKSSFASIAILARLLKFPQTHAVCLRKHDAHLRDSVFNQILWAVSQFHLEDYFTVRIAPMTLTYKPTGQVIYFKGLDDPLKLKSFRPPFGTVSTIWFEELEQYNGMEELRSVFQSLARGDVDNVLAIYSYNPPITSYSWVNQESMRPRKDRLLHKSSYLNAPAKWLGKSFILEAEALKKANRLAYDHEYLGIVTGTGGAVFRNIEERTITNEEIKNFSYIYQGLDWGFSVDPCAFVRVSYDSTRRVLYIIDEIYKNELFNTDLINELRNRGYDTDEIIADSAEPKSIAELWNAGIYIYGAKKNTGSVAYGIKFLQSLKKIVIDRNRTPNAYREFVMYEYEKDKTGNYKSIYPDRENHIIDAVRYSLNDVMGE